MWVTVDPWPPIALCAGFAVLFAGGLVSTKRLRYLVGVIVAIAACVVIFVVEQLIVTDTERIEASVHGVTSAFERGDAAATLAYISPAAAQERAAVSQALQLGEVHDLRVFDVAIAWSPDGSVAASDLRANGTIRVRLGGFESHAATRWRLSWKREGDNWKIVRIERLDPFDGQPIDYFGG